MYRPTIDEWVEYEKDGETRQVCAHCDGATAQIVRFQISGLWQNLRKMEKSLENPLRG